MRSRSTWACELKFWKARQAERHDVTLHVSVWVEIQILHRVRQRDNASRSTWACELKCLWVEIRRTWFPGHAPRERVSWNPFQTCQHSVECVTLHVSVWVEIHFIFQDIEKISSRSTWACELKFEMKDTEEQEEESRSTWACELKFCVWRVRWNLWVTLHVSVWVEIGKSDRNPLKPCVTLHVSVWVEMTTWKSWQIFSVSHAPRERVSWNAWYVMQIRELQVSRSTWACELKLKNSATQAEPIVSRSTWACELKYVKLWLVSRGFSHAPRERVSWNMFFTRYTFMY